ncbi:2-C-methyl-D-erythritol 4-phosphate cytidylyltransferase [Chitinispirillum alkaliphilum]|nr:2-C-methyl-D-erythritol 4-phosphate cytidylyltransferase [Chitinispirillum alkaliphilum]
MNKTDAIIVAAGSGSRLGYSIPKAFVKLKDKPILYYSLIRFASHKDISSVILVVSEQMINKAEDFLNNYPDLKNCVSLTIGGDQRWKSVRNGAKKSDAEWILVHDAARPFLSEKVIDSVLEMRSKFKCVITATPVVDTLRTFKGNTTGETVDRSSVIRVGTPQLLKRNLLLECFEDETLMTPPPTDEASLMERKGIKTGFSFGDPLNFKITTPADMMIAEALLDSYPEMLMGRE